ncbi:cytochrome P450 [Rhizopogon vinicolor AM-OR11-026]|uniref:Cytochrome P450 n=1 Tax=Rhizopogon vinicolor AM-OR11-026 TaxID=1314800 RepID=A0A1B7MKK6_9AGAM|nr:cytochrome P450 [Rhizopogon vinicolor AM-OR11-026]
MVPSFQIDGRRFIEKKHRPPLPPGPKPLPILGNVLSIDINAPWLTYTAWRAEYGDLIFMRILGQEVVLLNSQSVAQELLDRRSFIPIDHSFGYSFNFAFIGYGDVWRLSRRLFHQTFRPLSALKFRPMQIKRAREMVANLIDDPQNYYSHFGTFTLSVVMQSVYDYETSARDDPMVRLVEDVMAYRLSVITQERVILLKAFPFLLKLPDWCWGSKAENPLLNLTSMVAENLQRLEKQNEASKASFETALKNSATTAIMVFVLAMVLHPDAQERAQAEIDSVVGKDRLPAFEDRESLPYVAALMHETLRWQPVVPLGMSHATSSADIYEGYYIPKGATVICNTWALSRDEKRYPDASSFIPERFIDVNGALKDDDPADYIFGLGRRICPGRYSADASVWSAIVTLLATVNISYAKDDQGKVIDFTPVYTSGTTRITARPHIRPGLENLMHE